MALTTVPAAIKELDKIEIIQQADRNYRLNNAVTAKQKDILKAFNMTAVNIKEEAMPKAQAIYVFPLPVAPVMKMFRYGERISPT